MRGNTSRSRTPSTMAATSAAGSTGPFHDPYPVWLENATVLTGHTSIPSRCSGNTAALLPTWPYVTADWIDKICTMTMYGHGFCTHRARFASRDRTRQPGDLLGQWTGHGYEPAEPVHHARP